MSSLRGLLKSLFMKSIKDPRHQKRRRIVREMFAYSFSSRQIVSDETKQVLSKKSVIDKKIAKAAPAWPIAKLNKIDLAILRLAIYELFYEKETPVKVVIDEAVELAKEFGSEGSGAFVNGVLGTVTKNEQKN